MVITPEERTVLARIVADIETAIGFDKLDPLTGNPRFVSPERVAIVSSMLATKALIQQLRLKE